MAKTTIAEAGLTADRLRAVLIYDQDTGLFFRKWHVKRNMIGSLAARWAPHGYLRVNIDGASYLAHRLAWMYVYGEWPRDCLDHINCNKKDNRICNLREASRSQNLRNKSLMKTNTSGYKGVCFNKQRGKWQASIYSDKKLKHLGLFENREDAHKAYCEAAKLYHREFANFG